MATCGRCGGVNMTNEVCPECGAAPQSRSITARSQDISAIAPMQYAVTHGYSVAPFLDTTEIKRLFILASERPNQKYLSIDYESYIDSDVVFFTVTKTEYRKGAYSIIADLLDKRARRGKITLGISRYTVYELSQWDNTNDFNQILSPVDNGDTYKIPAIISCI